MIPQFKRLRAKKDPITARDWNLLCDMVTRIWQSLAANGIVDSTGLHIRRMPKGKTVKWGKVKSDWSASTPNEIILYPYNTESETADDSTEITAYIIWPKSRVADAPEPAGVDLKANDIVPYVSFYEWTSGDDEGKERAIVFPTYHDAGVRVAKCVGGSAGNWTFEECNLDGTSFSPAGTQHTGCKLFGDTGDAWTIATDGSDLGLYQGEWQGTDFVLLNNRWI